MESTKLNFFSFIGFLPSLSPFAPCIWLIWLRYLFVQFFNTIWWSSIRRKEIISLIVGESRSLMTREKRTSGHLAIMKRLTVGVSFTTRIFMVWVILTNLIIHRLISIWVYSVSFDDHRFIISFALLNIIFLWRNSLRSRIFYSHSFFHRWICVSPRDLWLIWLNALELVEDLNIFLFFCWFVLLGVPAVALQLLLVDEKVIVMLGLLNLFLVHRWVIFRNTHVEGVWSTVFDFDYWKPLRYEWWSWGRSLNLWLRLHLLLSQ